MISSPRHDFEASDPLRLVARPDLSVGIITYNHERYIAHAIESVLAQRTSFSFEIVIYEDCSTDETRTIALDFQRRHPDKIRVLYSAANVGVGENLKRGIAAYRGRYAAGLDGDDFWTDPLKLQAQFDALEARPAVNLCFSRAAAVWPDASRKSGWDYGAHDRLVPRSELLRTPGMVVPTSSLFFRTHVLHDSASWIFEAPVIDLFHVVAGASPGGAYYIAREMAAYRVMAEGSWSAAQFANYDELKVAHSQRMLEFLSLAENSYGLKRHELGLQRGLPHYILARNAFTKGDYREAIRHISKIGLRYPSVRLKQLIGIRSRRGQPD
jgi:glycosyltransferase involved in cell wall biosynthesis